MAKSMNEKNGGSTKPLVKTYNERPIVTAYRESAMVKPAKVSPFNILTNTVTKADSDRLQKAGSHPGRLGSGGRPPFAR